MVSLIFSRGVRTYRWAEPIYRKCFPFACNFVKDVVYDIVTNADIAVL